MSHGRPAPAWAAAAQQLAPWLAHARACARGYVDDLADPVDLDEDLWIDWRIDVGAEASPTDAWVLTLETMELLDLAVRADYTGGWRLVCENLDLSLYVELLDELPEKIYPKHTITWTDLGLDGSARLEHAKQLLTGAPGHSQGFLDVKAALLGCSGWQRCDAKDRVRVCLKSDLYVENEALEDLRRLSALTTLAQDPARLDLLDDMRRVRQVPAESASPPVDNGKPARRGGVFQVVQVAVNTSGVALTDQMLAYTRLIEQCGVCLSALTIGRCNHAPNETSAPATTRFLRATVLTEPTTNMALSIGRGMDLSVFQGVCSSLLTTQRINDVTFTAHPRGDHYWPWVAYSLFSCEASTRIQYVHLDVQRLSLQDVANVQRVLRARDPLAAIAPTPTSSISDNANGRFGRDRQVVDVRPNVTALVSSHRAETELCVVELDSSSCTGLRVVDESISRSHICVLYPGAGLCWVHRDDVLTRRVLPPQASPLRVTPFERISLELGPDTPLSALVALLETIGPLARILLLYSPQHVALPDAFLRDVMAACPNLVRLDLVMVTLHGFAWLLDDEAAYRLRQLSLTRVRCLDVDGYATVITAVGDSTTGIGRTLRELAIHHHWRVLSPLGPHLLATLATNHRLQRLIVRAEIAARTDAMAALARDLRGHHGDALHRRDKPLPRRCRLALLSVMAHGAVPELDAALLAIVFAFAAPNRRRVCGLATWSRARA